jgi:hypothetical protein
LVTTTPAFTKTTRARPRKLCLLMGADRALADADVADRLWLAGRRQQASYRR